MSTIGGPSGPGGPQGPGGPDGPDGPDATDGPDLASPTADAVASPPTTNAAAAAIVDKLAADIAAGKLSPQDAIDRLVDATAGPELGATERAELRELLGDLVANDPYLSGLINRV